MNKKNFAIITGATGGIGSEIARELKGLGYSLILHGNSNKEKLEKLCIELRNKDTEVYKIFADLSSFEACKELFKQCQSYSDNISVLINNAGITKDKLIIQMTDSDFDDVIKTNLNSVFYMTKLFIRPMIKKKEGRIINISSVVGIHGNAGQCNYSASKAGIIGLTKSLAKEYASKNILINAIAPGFIYSPMTNELNDNTKDNILQSIPLKRFGETKDIAKMVGFLLGEGGDYITGQVISVDGGLSI